MAAGDKVTTCTNNGSFDVYSLLNSCFGVDGSGNKYLRLYEYTQQADEEDAIDCLTTGLTPQNQFEQLLSEIIVFNAEGKPAIRVGQLP